MNRTLSLSDVEIILGKIFTNGQVWTSLINVIGAILFLSKPDFPKELWVAIVALVNSILAAVGIALTTIRTVRMLRVMRQQK